MAIFSAFSATSLRWAETLIHDVRYAIRSLRRAPGFTAVALVTLALGIGANAAMFGIVNGILLRPLPYAEPDRLVRLYQVNQGQSLRNGLLSRPDFEDWRDQTSSFASMAAYFRLPTILTGRAEPLELQVGYVTGDFFRVLGTPPQLGRVLGEEDHRQASTIAVISDRLWRTHFSADPGIIGSTIRVRIGLLSVVGIMPPSFRFPTSLTDIWIPETVLNDQLVGPRGRSNRRYEGVARLMDGISLERARSDLNSAASRLAAEYPQSNREWTAASVVPLQTVIVGDVNRALLVVLAVVGLILLIGAANLANLLLARGTARSTEMAIRTALGAARLRITRQLLTENLVLAVAGGVLGLLLAGWIVQIILALSAGTLPRVDDVRIDGRVIGAGLVLAVTTGLLFGLVPALRAAMADPQRNLKGTRGSVGHGRRLRSTFVVAQVALAVVLVIGAVLMTRSFLTLRGVDPGFNQAAQVLTFAIQFNLAGVPPAEWPAHIVRRREEIVERIARLPGVVEAGAVDNFPLQDTGNVAEYRRADGSAAPDAEPLRAEIRFVHPGYLAAMGIPLLRGDPLPDRQVTSPPFPMLISEAGARQLWPNESAVGRRVQGNAGMEFVIAGIVGDVRYRGPGEEPMPAVYVPLAMSASILMSFAVRTAGDPLALTGPVRRVIRELDPNQPIRGMTSLRSVMSESIARDRFFTVLYGAFGGLALVLAAIGVYGVLAYSVAQRTQEIGMRMALGARVTDVLRMVIWGGMRLVFTGLVLGTMASMLLTRVLEGQLYEISALDPIAFALAVALLGTVALVACCVPARRAMRIDPIEALRLD